MTQSQIQFLELLRAGLWGNPADPGLFNEETDWKSILRIAMEQTVSVIVADGIETLPQEKWPPKEAIFSMAMIRTKTAQMHCLLNSTINTVSDALEAEGIRSVLLKGQGVARCYRTPQSRNCGDIDLYVGEENFRKACDVLSGLSGVKMPDTIECESHILAYLGGVAVELHWKADVLEGKRKDRSWQVWTKESIDSRLCQAALPVWNNDGRAIALPDPTFNAVFILHHALRHLLSEGIGLRHVCDWAMFLNENHERIDKRLLDEKIREYGLSGPWKEFAILVHDCLGVPEDRIPSYPAKGSSSKTSKLMEEIFSCGNFGRHSSESRRPDEPGYLKRKWHSFRFQTLRLIRLFPLFPSTALSFGWNWLLDATLRFLTKRVR